MPIYTSRLFVIANSDNFHEHRRSSNSSSNCLYYYQRERFRSTLILLPNCNRKRFIQGIEVQCKRVTDQSSTMNTQRCSSQSSLVTSSDLYSLDESMYNYDSQRIPSITGESYSDIRHRLLAKSSLLLGNVYDDTDIDDNESYDGLFSIGYSHYHGCRRKF
jgi:hypothetical protein